MKSGVSTRGEAWARVITREKINNQILKGCYNIYIYDMEKIDMLICRGDAGRGSLSVRIWYVSLISTQPVSARAFPFFRSFVCESHTELALLYGIRVTNYLCWAPHST